MAGRMVIAAQAADAAQGKVIDLSFAYLRTCWAEERDLADEGTLAAIADSCGLDGAALLAAAKGDAAAAVFERNTDDAIANQVFGSPTWICKGELFWGQDRLDFLARLVEGGA
jgi:2-hydroxychromene-2-carboxylate isomerase